MKKLPSEEICNKSSIKKAELTELLGDVLSTVEKQNEMVRDLRAANDLLKTELLESQSTVIKIQSELWKCKKSVSKARSVKVTLTGNGSLNQILMKSRRLRTVEAYKSVFLSSVA